MEFTLDHSSYDQCELNSRNKMKNRMLTKSKLMNFQKYALNPQQRSPLTERIDPAVNCTSIRVKNISKLTNLMI